MAGKRETPFSPAATQRPGIAEKIQQLIARTVDLAGKHVKIGAGAERRWTLK
jgi:hypothetical protein